MSNLQDLKDKLAREAEGMTVAEAHAKRICIHCKKPPTFYSEVGRSEYRITGMCEPCFDELFKGDDEDESDQT